MNKKTSKRILALDILRGITIAGMILVNNPGSWSYIYAPLRHAEWNGLTPTDLVFPFFMFIMGISTYISLEKCDFKFSRSLVMKIMKRTVVLFLIGMAVDWFSHFCYYWAFESGGSGFVDNLSASAWTFDNIRIMGVLQRLALCYCVTALVALAMEHRYIPYLIVVILSGYYIILICGNGFSYGETNILSIVDRAALTLAHMYKDNGIEPEGLLSTLPAIAHVLLGFHIGRMTLGNGDKGMNERTGLLNTHILTLFQMGTVLVFSGWLLSYGCPINKKIWSPTFVLVTCGLASNLLALLIHIIDLKMHKKWIPLFEVFGINPLFMYVLADVLAILLGCISLPWENGSVTIQGFIYDIILVPVLGRTAGSLAYAVIFVAINWCVGYQLYRRRIYIKL